MYYTLVACITFLCFCVYGRIEEKFPIGEWESTDWLLSLVITLLWPLLVFLWVIQVKVWTYQWLYENSETVRKVSAKVSAKVISYWNELTKERKVFKTKKD